MDVFYKIIGRIYEETGGSEAQAIDLVDLVKREGFYGSYNDIFKELSSRAWIVETGKTDWIKITHWGVKEAKKAQSGETSADALKRQANFLLSVMQELNAAVEEFAKDSTGERLDSLEKKLNEMNKAFADVKANL